jgi:hypothetical protein
MEHCQKDKRDTKNLVLASIGQGGPIPHAELSPMPYQPKPWRWWWHSFLKSHDENGDEGKPERAKEVVPKNFYCVFMPSETKQSTPIGQVKPNTPS